jgi:hypothetical protein
MKLKYLKLFEAFESIKLSKTLGYIDVQSRDRFLGIIKDICREYDFPFSKLNDDMFQYLSYKKALNVNKKLEDSPCKATSKSEFSGAGIEGEKCEGGRIKRMWGSRQRIVDCPHCGGSGIEPKTNSLDILKFWFSKDGEFITMSGVDGTSVNKGHGKFGSESFSRNIGDYILGEEITTRNRNKLYELPHGTVVYLWANGNSTPVISYLYKQGNSDIFCLQDSYDGGSPYEDTSKIARFSWNVSGGDFQKIQVLEKRNKGEEDSEEEESNPFDFNHSVSKSWHGFSVNKRVNLEQEIKNANFALVFDFDKFKSSEFKKGSDISKERKERIAGSKLVVKDEDIRRANIDRYMKQIAENSDIIADVSNVKLVTNRIIGGQFSLFIIASRSSFENNLTRIINRYLEVMRNKESVDKHTLEYILNNLKDLIKNQYDTATNDVNNIRKTLEYCKKELVKDNKVDEYGDLISDLEEISKQITKKLMELPFDCISDLEVAKSKINTIRNIFQSDTYNLNNLRYFLDNVLSGREKRSYESLTNEYRLTGDDLEKTKKGLLIAKRVISRL